MKSIGAEQEDINKLYVEWYKWQDQIAKLQKDIYKDLDDAIDNELDEIKKFYDDQQDAIDAQIDAQTELYREELLEGNARDSAVYVFAAEDFVGAAYPDLVFYESGEQVIGVQRK